ncbi:uncharacterized protein C8A04DRAFT_31511 [Dichotomopilus funicola]|uniref:Uncharacterized protein n=1 Tax=Dichotomopilus funicola TaxID=1934379 RepID=A0AAN6UXQ6_9PEZI|nr:hypothetical protein C8A04DRAFT_31511 [Dichotomopilus funicola]
MQPRNDHTYDPSAGLAGLAGAFPGGPPDLDSKDWGEEDDPLRFLKAMGAGNPGALPLPEVMEAPKVQRLCAERSKAIFTSQARLRGILDRHEATIQKRWTKKTKQQRLTILKAAWEKLPTTH